MCKRYLFSSFSIRRRFVATRAASKALWRIWALSWAMSLASYSNVALLSPMVNFVIFGGGKPFTKSRLV